MALGLGSNLLHIATTENDLDWVKLLLYRGADPCVIDDKGQTSLYLAARYGYPDIVMALLNSDAGIASLFIPTPGNNTALHECLRGRRFKMTECVKELVHHGADVGLHNMDHESPVDLAVKYRWSKDILQLLIIKGRGPTISLGRTPLHIAARENNLDQLKMLLEDGTDPCAIDDKGQTSLYLAARHRNPDIVMALLNTDAGNASVFIPTTQNNTALHECLRGGRFKMTECVKELVHRGADVSLHNVDHESPVDLAVKYRWSKDIIELLILQGHGMDFDRQSPTIYTPLERMTFRPRRFLPLFPEPEWDDSLAVLFLQMGASRRWLKKILWLELNRKKPGNRLLDTLMDSFAYLPSLSQLEHSNNVSTLSCFQGIWGELDSFLGEIEHENTTFDLMTELPSFVAPVAASVADLTPSTADLDSHSAAASTQLPSRLTPASHVKQKKEDYLRRQKEIPTLAHLCRSTIRRTLKADVRQVISFPIPTAVKEYILLGYKLTSQDQKDGEKESVPSNSSSESGQPELSPSRS